MRPILLYSGFLFTTIVFLLIVKTFNISYPLSISSTQNSSELAVTGVGKAEVIPNEGTIQAGIQVDNAPTQQEVQNQMNKINDSVITNVQKLGIEKKYIQTTGYSINPSYDYTNGTQKINGFSGTASINITVKDFKKVSKVIDAATSAGATNVSNGQVSVGDPEKYQIIARQNAINDAKMQADKIAVSLGIHLGKVVNFVEQQQNNPGPIAYSARLNLPQTGGGAPTNIEPGNQTITSTVTLYFERK